MAATSRLVPLGLPTFRSSAWFSANVSLGPVNAGGDLSDPAVLQSVLRTRAFHNELILFAFDFCAVADALNLVMLLRHAGFEHFLPLGDGAATCAVLQRTAAEAMEPLPCWWSNWTASQTGWRRWMSAKTGCVSATHRRRFCVIEALWATRYAVAGRLLAGGANLLLMVRAAARASAALRRTVRVCLLQDLDTVLLRDPYAPLKRPPLARFNWAAQ
jgi:hypothetical protein